MRLIAVVVFFFFVVLSAPAHAQTAKVDVPLSGGPSASSDEVDFVVRSFRGGPDEAMIAAKCRALRHEWNDRWMGGRPAIKWTTPCEIVVHSQRPSYLAAVGRAGVATLGSSLVRRESDGKVTRRIDLLPSPDGELTALAHELVHVILADHFPDGPPPLWIDEGLAMLLDAPHKQSRHWRDCGLAIETGTMLPLQHLLQLDRPTSPTQFPAVYGQSLTLTKFLAERDDPGKLLTFVNHSLAKGYADALQTIYGIRDWEVLDREWREFVTSQGNNRS